MTRRQARAHLSLVLIACCSTSAAFAQSGVVLPADANVRSVLEYGAIPNDTADDLPAFQAAVNELVGTGRVLYVPDGVYRLSDRLNWGGVGGGNGFTLQGQSMGGTILRLDDNAAQFQNNWDSGDADTIADEPKPFIDAYEGNLANAFRNYLRDLTIEIGSGNPGAIGLQFQSNNTGRIEMVTIRSASPGRPGAVGLDLAFNFPGPFLAKNITIEGFDVGLRGAPQEFSVTFENLTIRDQNLLGMEMWRLPVQIRNLVSQNAVTAVRNNGNPGAWGHIVIDGASLTGGSSAVDAILNESGSGVIVLRNVTTSGYRFAVNDFEAPSAPAQIADGPVAQYTTDAAQTLSPSSPTIVPIPVEPTPDLPAPPLSQWVSVRSFGAIENDNLDDTDAVQAAVRSGAAVVYFPSGLYFLSRTIEIDTPALVRIEGLTSSVAINAPLAIEERALFRIAPGAAPVVHVGGFNDSFVNFGFVRAIWFEHALANTLVVRDGEFSYRNTVPGGRVFIENVVGSNIVFTGQRVWARQFNTEGSGEAPHIVNLGGDLDILGLKTEGNKTLVRTGERGRTAVLGGLNYPASAIAERTRPAFINDDSSVSISIPESCYVTDGEFAVWVLETRNVVTQDLTRAGLTPPRGHSNCGGMIALYNGVIADASPADAPETPALVSRSTDNISIAWAPAADAQSGIARYNVYRNGIFLRSVMPSTTPTLLDSGLPDASPFSYRVSAVNGAGLESTLSSELATSTLADTEPPRLLSAVTGLDPRRVELRFSEALAPGSVAEATNFTLQGPGGIAIPVISAAPSQDARRVTLTTAPMTPGTLTLALRNLNDRATTPNTIPSGVISLFNYSNTSAGTGLTGTYWGGRDFVGSPLLTRIDQTVDFNWGGVSPGSGVPVTNFSVRWSGQIQPRFNETYTLSVRADDGVRLFIDGVLAIDAWVDQGTTEYSVTLPLSSTRTHDIVMEYYQGGGGAEAQLLWQSPSQPREIIPTPFLFPTPRLQVVRTWNGDGADTGLVRFDTADFGTGQALGVFHSPASGGFHSAGYYRLDLSSFDLANNYPLEAVATLSQTFFAIGDGKRLINFFGIKQSAGADAWIETGPGHVTWDTAVGNDTSGALADPATATFVSSFLLDNTNFQNNNRPDKASFTGQRLLGFIRDDTDSRITLLIKRADASNEGQSWFTKDWPFPSFAPAIKLRTIPRCPAILSAPALPTSVNAGASASLLARVQGEPPIAYQWLRNGVPVTDGPGGASAGGGVIAGASGAISASDLDDQPEGGALSLAISAPRRTDAGQFSLRLSNACGAVVSQSVVLTVCVADFNSVGGVTVQDIFDFLAAYFAADPRADVNAVGGVGVQDIFDFLGAWFSGC